MRPHRDQFEHLRAEYTLPVNIFGIPSNRSAHASFGLLVLLSLFYGELNLANSVLLLWQMKKIHCAAEADGVQEQTKSLRSNNTTGSTFFKGYDYESSE